MAPTAKTSPLVYARLAGILYLLLIPFSAFGLLYVPSKLIVPGDAATTASNIVAAEALFRSAIVSHLIGQTIFILLPLVLYKLLKPVNKNHAVLMVVLVLVSVPITFINELNHFAALILLSGADYLSVFSVDQLHAQMMLFLELHEHGITIALIFWGLWLFPLGYLVFKSGFLPKILGVLLMIGCIGYLIDALTTMLFSDFDMTVSQFTFVGELLFPLWLVFKGVNVERWEKLVLASENSTS
jgi:hypothetical protein